MALKRTPSRRKLPAYRQVGRNLEGREARLAGIAGVGRPAPARRRAPPRSKSNDLDLVSDAAASAAIEWGAVEEAFVDPDTKAQQQQQASSTQAPASIGRRRAPPRSKSNDLDLVSDGAASAAVDWGARGDAFVDTNTNLQQQPAKPAAPSRRRPPEHRNDPRATTYNF